MEEDFPTDLRYTKDHEWVRIEGDHAVVGITDYAQDELGDIVFVELPEVGSAIEQLEELGVVESVKTVSTVYAPLSGEVVEINEDLLDAPGTINDRPYEDGWLVRINMSDLNEVDDLLTSEEYQEHLESGHDD